MDRIANALNSIADNALAFYKEKAKAILADSAPRRSILGRRFRTLRSEVRLRFLADTLKLLKNELGDVFDTTIKVVQEFVYGVTGQGVADRWACQFAIKGRTASRKSELLKAGHPLLKEVIAIVAPTYRSLKANIEAESTEAKRERRWLRRRGEEAIPA